MKDKDNNIPTLTKVVGVATDNEFNFDGLVPGKALNENDIKNLKLSINQIIKTKIHQHSEKLYQELAIDINKTLQNLHT